MSSVKQNPNEVAPLRHLFWPGQILAWLLVLSAIVGMTLAQMVPGPGGAFGRVRSLGLIADGMMMPVLGFFLGAALAVYFRRRGWQVFYAVVGAVAGLIMLVLPLFMALDLLEVRRIVQPDMRPLYTLNSVRSVAVVLTTGVFLLFLAVKTWRASRDLVSAPGVGGSKDELVRAGAPTPRV